MAYSAQSSIVGYTAIAPGWRAALTARGALPDADTILAAYDTWARAYHLDPNLALAQGCHEATWYTSARWLNENNPAGLGITANNTPPNPFATPQEGIQAHLEHLAAYCYDLAECPVNHGAMADRRHVFHKGSPTLAGLEDVPPKWAVPGTGYVASIVSIANSIAGAAPMPTADYPTEADIGCPVRIETTDFVGADRALEEIQWGIVHDTEGKFEGDIAVLTHGSKSGSVHFIIGREEGQFVASVPIRTAAYTAGNDQVGALAIQWELSKHPPSGEVGYTDWQYRALAASARWCIAQGATALDTDKYYWPHPPDADGGPLPDVPGWIGHAGVPDGNGGWGGFAHHQDPGDDFDWDRFIALLRNAPAHPPSDVLNINGFVIGGGFKRLYTATSVPLQTFGNPLSDEVQATVTDADKTKRQRTVQQFERAIFIYQPEQPPDWQVVSALRNQKIKTLP